MSSLGVDRPAARHAGPDTGMVQVDTVRASHQIESRSAIRTALVVAAVAVALFVRVGWVMFAPMPEVTGDAAGYDAAARRLITHGYFAFGSDGPSIDTDRPNAITMPGYPVFLAAIIRGSGDSGQDHNAARIAQAVLGATTVLIMYFCAQALFGPWAALLAVWVLALWPPLIAENQFLLTEPLFELLIALAFFVFIKSIRSERGRMWTLMVLVGLLLGMATMVRPAAIAVGGALVVCLLFVVHSVRGYRWRLAMLLSIVVLLTVTPWTVRNAVLYHRFVPLTTNSAHGIYVATFGVGEDYMPWTQLKETDEFARNEWFLQAARTRLNSQWAASPTKVILSRLAQWQYAIAMPQTGVGPLFFVPPIHQFAWLASVALFVLRWHDENVAIMAAIPAALVVFHIPTLLIARYVQPAMPWVLVMFSAAVFLLGRSLLGTVLAPRAKTP